MTRSMFVRHGATVMGVWLLATAVTVALPQRSLQPEAMLGAALHLEEVEGDVDGAIVAYERIIAHPAVDRATAGRALLRLGLCYEKLGRPGALAYYDQVIREFPDRSEVVTEALIRVRSLGADERVSMPGQDLVARQIVQSYQPGGPSRDGRFFTVIDSDTGHLEVRDLRTGESHRVTDGYPQIVQESIFSPDGETIAYSVFPGGNDNELRIVNRDGSGERVVLAQPDVAYVRPEAWSRDGASVLAVLYRADGGTSLALIAVADGRTTVVRATQPGEGVPSADLSPDGRYVVFDRLSDTGSDARDVVVAPTTGGREQLIAGSAADDRGPIWSADGSSVLFLSNRGGEYDLWAQPVAGGSPQGAPHLVRGGIGNVELRGLTEDGSLYYGSFTQFYDVRQARYDSDSGRLTALPASELETRPGLNRFPWWSPDGRRIAYVHRPPGSSARRHSLVVQTVATGEQREFELGRWQLARVRGWSADGTRVLIVAWGDDVEQVGHGIYWLHAGSGEVELFARQGGFAGAQLSPRGDTIYIPRRSGIVAYDIQNGQMRSVGPSQGFGAMSFSFAVSPDGRLLAFQAADEFLGGGVMVMDATGGEARELYRPGSMLHGLTFTPDGRHLLALSDTDDDEAYAVRRIPVDGGPAQETGLVLNVDNKLSGLTFHPDGRTFTYVDGHSRGEVWMLERLMADAPGR